MAADQQDVDRDRAMAVRAALLLNFARFVDWPEDAFADAESPIVFGVFGEDDFIPFLERTVKDRTIDNRSIVVRRLTAEPKRLVPDERELRSCHLLSVGSLREAERHALFRAIDRAPVLTVSEGENFAKRGGVIGLDLVDGRYTFTINIARANHATLRISSKLLALARVIEEDISP